jgi:hypothetical protein
MRQGSSLVAAVLICICLHAANVPASADTITFDSVPSNFYESVVTQGVIFSRAGIGAIGVISGEANCILCASNGTQYVSSWGNPPVGIEMRTVSGDPFSLVGFDAAESFALLPERWAQQIDVTGELAGGGTVAASFTLDQRLDGIGGLEDFQRFLMPAGFTGLSSVSFYGNGNTPPIGGLLFRDFAIDNIATDLPAPVPEPGTVGLVLAGLVAVSGARHKRRGGIGTASAPR